MSYENDIPMQLALAAHAGTSFTPEKRAEQVRAEYAAGLAADRALFEEHARKGGTIDSLEAEFERYRAGLRRRYSAYLMSKSRCVSTMIAGPSNFPARRMQKRSDIADRRCAALCDYQETARAAVIRTLRPDLQPIRTEDSDAVSRLGDKLESCKRLQERMKAANAAIRKHAKAGADAQVAALVALGFKEPRARDLLKPDFAGRIGFADYELKNNGAEIRRLEGRVKVVSEAQASPCEFYEGERAKVEVEPAANRVRILFPGKPDVETRDRLKANGFRWAPSAGAWQAYRNFASVAFAKREAGVTEVPA